MRIIIGTAAGAAIGFTIGFFGRCSTGACPLTGNPWTSALIGALMGFMITTS
ncbi:MAG: YtxH domain-containing protein [Candidatus Omnitrophica bacterium]|nr:YtxH domain-containing protein [Candidatus Omnitrophota bacterium]MDE2231950.1 YtxH domain-containing protein [Candidatus Omnitrophota bacterium]